LLAVPRAFNGESLPFKEGAQQVLDGKVILNYERPIGPSSVFHGGFKSKDSARFLL
jgi:hypothetical protein